MVGTSSRLTLAPPGRPSQLVLAPLPLSKGVCRKWLISSSEAPYGIWRPEGYQPSIEEPTQTSIRDRFGEFLYTDDEYNAHVAGVDTGWTREETDHLIQLVLDMNLKWPCVHDAYFWPPKRERPPRHQITTENDELLDLAESDDSDTEDTPPVRRSVEDLKDRFYRVCKLVFLARKSVTTSMEEPSIAAAFPAQLEFDATSETRRKEEAEARFAVNSEVVRRERALREAVARLQEVLKVIDKEGDWPQTTNVPPLPFDQNLIPPSDGTFVHDHLASINATLLPAVNLTSAMGKHRGCWLISQALKMPIENIIGSALLDPRSKGRGASSSVPGRPPEVAGPNLKEIADGSMTVLRGILKEWSAQPEEDNPRTYFAAQSFAPPINSRQCFEAYVALKVDAAVCYQLQKQKDRTQELYQQWAAKLQELRRAVRTARRTQQRGTTDRWRGASSAPKTAIGSGRPR